MVASLTAGIVLGLSAGFSPGPLFALVISQSLRHGVREGLKVAMVPLITDLPILLISMLVLTRLARFNLLLAGITFGGAFLLLYLAYESFQVKGFEPESTPAAPKSLGKGILVNTLSPHPYLFWLTVGGPIIVRGWNESVLAGAGFVAAFYVCLVGAKISLAVAIGKSRHLIPGRPYVYIMRGLGVLLLFFAALLFHHALQSLGVIA